VTNLQNIAMKMMKEKITKVIMKMSRTKSRSHPTLKRLLDRFLASK